MRWLLAAFVLFWTGCTPTKEPEVFLVAGEGAEDFRFLDPGTLGIAYRSGTIVIEGDRFDVVPRTAAMFLPVKGTLHSIVRLESKGVRLPGAQPGLVGDAVRRLTDPPAVTGVILDFAAAPAERRFYRAVLEEVRARLPRSKPLSITAPVEWCISEPWIDGLPVREAIPILIHQPTPPARDALVKLCRDSLLLPTSAQRPRQGRRLYYVHNAPWDQHAVAPLR